jgi:hypothetical protein
MNTLQQFEYNNQVIEFEMAGSSLMINATEMAKIFGKRIDFFLKSDHAKEFIKVLEFTPFGGNSAPLKKHEIIQTKGQNGTWMHRLLALKFAAWLSPEFELWVYQTIDEFMFGDYRRMQEELRLSAARKNRIDELRNQLVASDEYCELVKLELEEKQAAYRRTKHNRMQLELFRSNLN